MIALLRHYGEGPVTVRHISEREKISLDYIEQLLIKLKRGGLIKVVRGRKGGFLLARPPEKIKIADIMHCVGESLELAPCIEIKTNGERCVLDRRCLAKKFFEQMAEKLHEMMGSTSLQDLYPEAEEAQDNNKHRKEIEDA